MEFFVITNIINLDYFTVRNIPHSCGGIEDTIKDGSRSCVRHSVRKYFCSVHINKTPEGISWKYSEIYTIDGIQYVVTMSVQCKGRTYRTKVNRLFVAWDPLAFGMVMLKQWLYDHFINMADIIHGTTTCVALSRSIEYMLCHCLLNSLRGFIFLTSVTILA